MLTLALVILALGTLPSSLLLANLLRYRRAPRDPSHHPHVSVLIPARNEEANIRACLESVLANKNVTLEVLVLDDHSTDQTAALVREIAAVDSRVRLISSQPLPRDWRGKQFACHQLSQLASAPYLCFIDADVRLSGDALTRSIAFLRQSSADLVSGVPRQLTDSFSERLLVPLIHFVLLAYLPFGLMRRFQSPAFAAGCGQLFIARRASYRSIGGHRSVASSGHDGIQLPRAFRARGYRTDLFDATDLASCKMYSGASEVWAGLAKNATEGIARPTLILPFTILFLFGQVLPPILLAVSLVSGAALPFTIIFGVGTTLNYAARFACSWRFEQSWLGAALHPVAILSFLGLQWWALYQEKRGRPFYWKGRPQTRIAACQN